MVSIWVVGGFDFFPLVAIFPFQTGLVQIPSSSNDVKIQLNGLVPNRNNATTTQ
jgi:hypothetical protein